MKGSKVFNFVAVSLGVVELPFTRRQCASSLPFLFFEHVLNNKRVCTHTKSCSLAGNRGISTPRSWPMQPCMSPLSS